MRVVQKHVGSGRGGDLLKSEQGGGGGNAHTNVVKK